MKELFNIIIGIIFALVATMSVSVAGERDLIGQMLGQGLGAYGGAKLCGGGTAKQIACGSVGSILGGALLAPRKQQPSQHIQNQLYPVQQPYPIEQPAYQTQYIPRMPRYTQNCQQIAVAMPDGSYGTGLMCRMTNGYWQMVSVNPVN